MKNVLFILAVLLYQTHSPAQRITVTARSMNGGTAVLSSLSGENIVPVDSAAGDEQGRFQFSFKNRHAGVYRITFGTKASVDCLYDNEDAEIETGADGRLTVSRSESNRIYQQCIKLNREYKLKSELLQLIIARYPQDDPYFQTSKDKFLLLQKEYLAFVTAASQARPNSFAARYVRSSQLPVVDFELPFAEQLLYLKTHALDHVDFTDAELTYSDAFTNKTIEYLTYYRNPQMPKEVLEKEFSAAADSILNKARANRRVYQHIVEYLIDGFRKFGYDGVIGHIVQEFVVKDDICLDGKSGNAVQRLIDQNKRLPAGATAPNIALTDIGGKPFDLYTRTDKNVLLVFYASRCPHCTVMLPQLGKILQTKKNVEAVAISLDTVRADWKAFAEKYGLNFTHVSDLKGWDGAAAKDYCIYATPTMFLLDSKKKIIAKPLTIDALKEKLAP